MLTAMTVEGGTVKEVFLAFVEHLLCPHLRVGHVVVLDNLLAHKNLEVRALIEARGARVLFLPPYSPELNPIECAWAKLKAFIKKLKPRTPSAIDDAIERALPTISDADTIGWFEHCGIRVRQNVG
jgi:transposase